jgi:hypothetical protein
MFESSWWSAISPAHQHQQLLADHMLKTYNKVNVTCKSRLTTARIKLVTKQNEFTTVNEKWQLQFGINKQT